ncbi:hypothetical protein GCM10010885_18330 [Alicyclobacillus cellulosilyticus]|uniref:Uncharacterized protein n=2 Tax=Alicyclobacillus cellulosilyticus TaxID=1003997 RepID=A0A917KCW1_9BACL|nr:hypothetical protein GCM10010885_18330 [Alicyclobacillus cellulosilyticus]
MAATAVSALAMIALGYLMNTVTGLYIMIGAGSTQVSDTSMVYWQLERLAQNAIAVGTQPLSSASGAGFQTNVTGQFKVLALRVSSLQGIVPESSAVYSAVQAGDFVCVAVVPWNGMHVFALFPGGEPYNPDANPPVLPPDLVPIPDTGTDFSQSVFQVNADGSFQVVLQRQVGRTGAYVNPTPQNSLGTLTFSFVIGKKGY